MEILEYRYKKISFVLPKVVGQISKFAGESGTFVDFQVLSFFRMLFPKNYRNRLIFHKVIQEAELTFLSCIVHV